MKQERDARAVEVALSKLELRGRELSPVNWQSGR